MKYRVWNYHRKQIVSVTSAAIFSKIQNSDEPLISYINWHMFIQGENSLYALEHKFVANICFIHILFF